MNSQFFQSDHALAVMAVVWHRDASISSCYCSSLDVPIEMALSPCLMMAFSNFIPQSGALCLFGGCHPHRGDVKRRVWFCTRTAVINLSDLCLLMRLMLLHHQCTQSFSMPLAIWKISRPDNLSKLFLESLCDMGWGHKHYQTDSPHLI